MMEMIVGDDGDDATDDSDDGNVIENDDHAMTMTILMMKDDEQHS